MDEAARGRASCVRRRGRQAIVPLFSSIHPSAGGLGGSKRGSREALRRCLREVVVIRSAMAEQDDLLAAAEAIPALVNGDETLLRRGRFLDVDLMLEIGGVPCYITVRGGRVTSLETGLLLMRSWSFAIRGSENAWRQFWRPLPPPHFHDVCAREGRRVPHRG